MKIEYIELTALNPYEGNARLHSKKQIAQLARSIERFGFNNPIIIDDQMCVLAGHGRLEAAKNLKLSKVPVISLAHLSEKEKKAYVIADNKIPENSTWDLQLLKVEIEKIIELDTNIDLTITGFETPEIDLILCGKNEILDKVETAVIEDKVLKQTKYGDLWKIGNHYLYCGNALEAQSFERLLQGKKADVIFTDPPYNVKIDGFVCGKGKVEHKEFAFASGELTKSEFKEFLEKSFINLKNHSLEGSIHYICMDWRHIDEITHAGKSVYDELKNVCVWNKQLAGMGSLYRSQHEFIFVYKNGQKPHINNIELGKHGRNRSNIWDYPGVHVSNIHSKNLHLHPTVKPVSMISDAIIDCSPIGGIVLDCFAGSGSTLLAAERARRSSYLIEYEPHYCDVILHRALEIADVKIERICTYE